MKIAASEYGVTRLFVIDLPAHEVPAFLTEAENWPLQEALGAIALNEKFVDVVAIEDIQSIGLSQYLIQGTGIPEDQIAPLSSQLEQIKGHVVLISSSAFQQQEQTLSVRAPIRHIASFFSQEPSVSFEDLPQESAAPGSGEDQIKKAAPSQAAMMGRIATFALLFMFLFTGFIIWLAG